MPRRRDRSERSKGEGRHVRLYHWLLGTPAWKSLGAVERSIYIEMAAAYNGSNNGKIVYSVRQAAETLRIGKSKAAEAIGGLVERGFIVAVVKGGFNRKARHATEWRLTEFSSDLTGELPTKEFARWQLNGHWPQVGAKIQNTVPVGGLTVPVGGPIGTCGRTMNGKKGSDGTCGRTETPILGGSSVPVRGHIYSTRAETLPTVPAERGRSVPTGSAVASPRVLPPSKSSRLNDSHPGKSAA
jgi:hypothetical protein